MNNRYPGGGDCSLFATDIDAAYINYYKIKEAAFVDNSVITRKGTADTQSTNYQTAINDVGGNFTSALNTLTNTADSVINP